MASNAYVQAEDLGLTVLGTTQVSYTVNGEHHQDYDVAVYRAALCRTAALEEALVSYNKLAQLRQKKLDDLGECLAALNAALGNKTSKTKTTDYLSVDATAAATLRRYGFDNAAKSMTYPDIMKLAQDVEYEMDQEDNELQQDMTQLQSFVSKRDDAMEMAAKLVQKVSSTRQKGIGYIGS